MKKLSILADAAKYDVSCSSSGVERGNKKNAIGSTRSFGICHSWSADGRCISLLKVLLSNDCVYDCKYCVNRCSADVERASFDPHEIAELTIEFYRRNYIEGLFLSSAVEISPDYTSEKMLKALDILRNTYHFNGYIHAKVIPGSDPVLVSKIGLLADRLSVNIELPSESSLKLLAPQKKIKAIISPMQHISNMVTETQLSKKIYKHAPRFAPAGQSTQMIIGATRESDMAIVKTAEKLYQNFSLKRVYYSAYVPTVSSSLLPAVTTQPPLLREHRLYQADWLLRYYNYTADEIVSETHPFLDLQVDPKASWALRNMHQFPMEINKVSYEQLLRIPGIGVKSAMRIVRQRRIAAVKFNDLSKMGVVIKRAKYFITCCGKYYGNEAIDPGIIRNHLIPAFDESMQLSMF